MSKLDVIVWIYTALSLGFVFLFPGSTGSSYLSDFCVLGMVAYVQFNYWSDR